MTATLSAEVTAAAERIRRYVRHTPVLRTEFDGRPLVLKLEQLQRTGSFKLRGALNALLSGPRPDQVVTASGGNHGIGVATAASILGLPATVYAPVSIPESKARRIEEVGARLVRVGTTYAEAAAAAHEMTNARYVEAYNDRTVIAGQGTVAAEIVEDVPETDVIAVAVGGGGLAAGIALGSGGRQTVAAEPQHCCCLNQALAAGHPVDAEVNSVASSALGATRVGDVPFEVLTSHPVRSVLVGDEEILAARDLLWHEFRLAVEPAAATPFAAWLAGHVSGELPCLVLCGANADWTPSM
ncbi:serine/threonine dehydratase [Amycolatopsis acidiphila]|uniref:Pyridoxal-phosphate dependent enzyme n=1 Tax=Amycolatopsis acidiphila TaxID=715473 RepID=A0A558AFV4_9PSEU|nr:serine/threonine dehydratase [Amycolatopsis acidiphila]TVT23148.1 pyridoxal-phosphate dependent enzyme [Amycolatopsis acidiphila]UIJ60162.1 serine/threonine dehydratase [Amycolatopsis acidiphila]GHG60991.1 serine/threonine dehydratase [Amycolatopsis acidiphila]